MDPRFVLAAVAGYLIGGFPSGVLWAKLVSGRDLRREGSGHTGGLNALRVSGRWAAALTALCDLAKGVIALRVGQWIVASPWALPVAGLAAVAGHIWSPYLRFKGGMGLATMAGIFLWLQPLAVAAFLVAWVVAYRLLHHRPRATAVAILLAAASPWVLRAPLPVATLGTLGAVLVALRHVPDFQRRYEPGVL